MGFFGKRKNRDSQVSTLSETEIQKRLYGEFQQDLPGVVVSERVQVKEPRIMPPIVRETPKGTLADEGIQKSSDLFSHPSDTFDEMKTPQKQVSLTPPVVDTIPRHVPLRDFEKKNPVSSSFSGAENSLKAERNRQGETKKGGLVFLGKTSGFLKDLFHAKNEVARRYVLWSVAILGIFLLFWGVNVLNSQRDTAMRDKYRLSGATKHTVAVSSPIHQTSVSSTVRPGRREVTMTPVTPKQSTSAKFRTNRSVAKSLYVIQVVTYPNQQDAQQVVDAFKRENITAYVKEDKRPSGRIFYLVIVGGFHSEAEAQSQLLKFRAKDVARPFQDAFVKSSS